jgi:hypothetical protein
MKYQFKRAPLAPQLQSAHTENTPMRAIADFIFVILFFVLLVGWLLAWAAFHVAGGAIHLLLIIAVVSLIIHFFRGRRAV